MPNLNNIYDWREIIDSYKAKGYCAVKIIMTNGHEYIVVIKDFVLVGKHMLDTEKEINCGEFESKQGDRKIPINISTRDITPEHGVFFLSKDTYHAVEEYVNHLIMMELPQMKALSSAPVTQTFFRELLGGRADFLKRHTAASMDPLGENAIVISTVSSELDYEASRDYHIALRHSKKKSTCREFVLIDNAKVKQQYDVTLCLNNISEIVPWTPSGTGNWRNLVWTDKWLLDYVCETESE